MSAALAAALFVALASAFPEIGSNFTSYQSATLSCVGTTTYAFTPSSTVFVTVDEEYTVTGNASAPEIIYTPPPPCSEVIDTALSTSSSTTTSSSEPILSWETTTSVECTTNSNLPNITAPYANSTIPPLTTCESTTLVRSAISGETWGTWSSQPSWTASAQTSFQASSATATASFVPELPPPEESTARSTRAGTTPINAAVTVTVTKKTPAPNQNNAGGAPTGGPTFPGDTGVGSVNNGGTTSGGGERATNSPKPTTNGGQGGSTANNNNNNNNPATTGSNNNNNNNNDNRPGTTSGNNNNNNNGQSTSGGGLGSIINSAFNSPFTSVGVSTSYGTASATVTLVNGVPVQVGASTVYIGGSNVALPSGSSTAYVTINGQTFTVGPSAVVAGGQTLDFNRAESVSYSAVQAATLAASTITQNGVVITVQPTQAIVSGRTFTIGLNADATTTVINGQTITFNSNGIVFQSTTYNPAMTTAAAYVVTTIGKLTFSIDQTEAIINGTTFRIGAGALNSKTTTVIDGTTVVFGPSGIVLPSTTVAPTGVSLTDDSSSSTTGNNRVVSDTSGASSSGGAGMTVSRPPSFLSNTVCIVAMLLGAGTLPLSLVL